MLIRKIKITDIVQIFSTEVNGTKTRDVETKSADQPTPEFKADWERLKTLANEILDSALDGLKFKVTSITFEANKAGDPGCIMHVQAQTETSRVPWHFNTPVKYRLPEGLDESHFYLSGEGVDLLTALQTHAENYCNGVKAQTELELVPNVPDAPQLQAGNKNIIEMADAIVEESKPRPANRRKVS